jgi:hypothetical protein
MGSNDQGGQAPQQKSAEGPFYVIIGWIRPCGPRERSCELCGEGRARFTYVGYNEEEFEPGLWGSGEAGEAADEWLCRAFARTVEVQRRGAFLAAAALYVCGGCLAPVLDGFMGSLALGAATVATLLSPGAARVSCVVAARVLSSELGTLSLLYTDAETIDELLPQLREPGVRLFVSGPDETGSVVIEQEVR